MQETRGAKLKRENAKFVCVCVCVRERERERERERFFFARNWFSLN